MNENRNGFTIIELMVVVGIILILFSLSWINFTSLPSRASLQTDLVGLTTDLKSQQISAMTGDTGGGVGESDYSIHFENSTYTLFQGDVYTPGATGNFTVDLDNANLSFTNNSFSNSIVTFTKGSGEITPGQISIKDSLNGNIQTMKLNKYGATY